MDDDDSDFQEDSDSYDSDYLSDESNYVDNAESLENFESCMTKLSTNDPELTELNYG